MKWLLFLKALFEALFILACIWFAVTLAVTLLRIPT